jgi:hypothetical protein
MDGEECLRGGRDRDELRGGRVGGRRLIFEWRTKLHSAQNARTSCQLIECTDYQPSEYFQLFFMSKSREKSREKQKVGEKTSMQNEKTCSFHISDIFKRDCKLLQ